MSDTIITSAEAMMALGREYAAEAKGGDVFALTGTLGTGKTHWTKGFMELIDPVATVSSPTFAIVNEYRGGMRTVFHFDFYRLNSAEELLNLGWDEYLDEGAVTICEWADLFPQLIPANATWLEISHLPDGTRKVTRIGNPTG